MFQDRVKYIRGRLKQKEFAAKLGVSLGSVQHWEIDGQIPRGDILIRIKEVFNININWLLTGDGEPYLSKDGIEASGPPHPQQSSNVVELQHMDLVRGFRDKQRALNINRELIELEALDQEIFRRVESYIKGTLDTIRVVAERTPYYGPERRKRDRRDKSNAGGIQRGKDRRRGQDRRKAGGG